jgi:hypothetical protein
MNSKALLFAPRMATLSSTRITGASSLSRNFCKVSPFALEKYSKHSGQIPWVTGASGVPSSITLVHQAQILFSFKTSSPVRFALRIRRSPNNHKSGFDLAGIGFIKVFTP